MLGGLRLACGQHGATERTVGLQRNSHSPCGPVIRFELRRGERVATEIGEHGRGGGTVETKLGAPFQITVQRLRRPDLHRSMAGPPGQPRL